MQAVASVGLTADTPHGAFGSVRLRHFGPRPLIEDNSVRSNATSLLNAQAGYDLTPRMHVVLDAFNFLNSAASDVDYYYPTLPRTLRVVFRVQF